MRIYYKVLKMNFGDWELFRIVLSALRDKEYLISNETNSNINFKHTRSGSSKNNSHERRGNGNSIINNLLLNSFGVKILFEKWLYFIVNSLSIFLFEKLN